MPIWTYTPDWDVIREWFEKCAPLLPDDYSGLVGIRLHRTGNPLTFELFGAELPDKPLYPLLILELERGKPTRSWEALEEDFDVPWAKEADFHRYREDVMTFYHAEDLLEPAAEKVLEADAPEEETQRRVLVDHTQIPA